MSTDEMLTAAAADVDCGVTRQLYEQSRYSSARIEGSKRSLSLSLRAGEGEGDREKENTVTCKVHVIMVIIIIVSDRSTRLRQLTNNDNETRYQ